MKQGYIVKKFGQDRMGLIKTINGILTEYGQQGFVLTLRQLYYQLVARDYIPNKLQSYKRIVEIVGDGRLAGVIDWGMIVDRNRETMEPPAWEDPAQIVGAAASQFVIDKWEDQDIHIEVMVEKDALSGVLAPVCNLQQVTFTANKGYSSLSNLHTAGERLRRYSRDGKLVYVFYLGDHDPSGIDMTRDISERLAMFSGLELGVDLRVKRLALNYEQVEVLKPPENPAKETDSRYQSYMAKFGESCWELDAIEPRALADLVNEAIIELRDGELWEEAQGREDKMRAELKGFVQDYRKRKGEGIDEEE